MNRCARNLDALFERGFVNVKAVKSLSAEGGDQRGVNVEDLIGERLVDLLVKDGEEARENDEVDARRGQRFCKSLRICGNVGVILAGKDDGVDPVLRRK